MTNRIAMILLTVCVALVNTPPAFCQQSAPSAEEKIKRRIKKIGLNGEVTVTLASGAKIYGAIKNIEDGSFYVSEVNRINLAVINYGDVRKVREGYCEEPFTGRARACPSRRARLIASVAAAGGLVVLVTVLAAQLGKS